MKRSQTNYICLAPAFGSSSVSAQKLGDFAHQLTISHHRFVPHRDSFISVDVLQSLRF